MAVMFVVVAAVIDEDVDRNDPTTAMMGHQLTNRASGWQPCSIGYWPLIDSY